MCVKANETPSSFLKCFLSSILLFLVDEAVFLFYPIFFLTLKFCNEGKEPRGSDRAVASLGQCFPI